MTLSGRRLFLWFIPAALGLATAAVLAAGFAAALQGRLGERVDPSANPAPTPAAPLATATADGVFRIVALGDSLTRGTGDEAGGGGYPERVAAALRKDGRLVAVENLAVDGIGDRGFAQKDGRRRTWQSRRSAQLILVSIGGNDLSHSIRSAALPGETAADPTAAALRRGVSQPSKNSSSSFAKRTLLPPSDFSASTTRSPRAFDRRTAKETLLKWNVALEEASYSVSGTSVVPTADLFDERPDRLSSDRFHPGPSGYGEIASRVLSTLNLPAAAPRKS